MGESHRQIPEVKQEEKEKAMSLDVSLHTEKATTEIVYRIYEIREGLLRTPRGWHHDCRCRCDIFSDKYETMEAACEAVQENTPDNHQEFVVLPVAQKTLSFS